MLNDVEANRCGELAWLEEEFVVPKEESTLSRVLNGDSYFHIDDDALCFADEDSYDNDDIVEEIASKRTQVEKRWVDEDDDEEDSKLMVTHAIARCSV